MPVNLPGTFDLGPFSLLGRDETSEQDLGDGRIRREFALRIAAYEPGEVQVPPIDVTYLGPRGEVKTARTAPVAIKIASLIANEPEPALKDAAAPVSVMEENRVPPTSAGRCSRPALGALITFFIVRKLRARRGDRPGPPPRPAHEIALERLDRLGALGFLENADNRPFYFAVSEVDPRLPGRALRLRFAGDDHRRADRRAAGVTRPRLASFMVERGPGAGCRPATW